MQTYQNLHKAPVKRSHSWRHSSLHAFASPHHKPTSSPFATTCKTDTLCGWRGSETLESELFDPPAGIGPQKQAHDRDHVAVRGRHEVRVREVAVAHEDARKHPGAHVAVHVVLSPRRSCLYTMASQKPISVWPERWYCRTVSSTSTASDRLANEFCTRCG